LRVQGGGFRVQSSEFGVKRSGFKAEGFKVPVKFPKPQPLNREPRTQNLEREWLTKFNRFLKYTESLRKNTQEKV